MRVQKTKISDKNKLIKRAANCCSYNVMLAVVSSSSYDIDSVFFLFFFLFTFYISFLTFPFLSAIARLAFLSRRFC